MQVHLVFVAKSKYRRQIFDPDAIEKLRSYFASVCADFDVELGEMDGECHGGKLFWYTGIGMFLPEEVQQRGGAQESGGQVYPLLQP